MPEAGQDPEKNGPLLTPRGKALVRKVALAPLWPVIWAGRAIWKQHDRFYAWTTKAWETRHQQPPAKTFGEKAGRAALWVFHGYFAVGRKLGSRVEIWWKGTPPSQAPGPANPATAPTVADRLASLKSAASGAFATLQKSAANWQAKRAAERAEAEMQAAAAREAAETKAAAERLAAAAAKPAPQKPAAAPAIVAQSKEDAGGTTVNGVPLSQFPEEFRELAEIIASLGGNWRASCAAY